MTSLYVFLAFIFGFLVAFTPSALCFIYFTIKRHYEWYKLTGLLPWHGEKECLELLNKWEKEERTMKIKNLDLKRYRGLYDA